MPPILLMKRTLDDLEDLYDFDDSDGTDEEDEILEPHPKRLRNRSPVVKEQEHNEKEQEHSEKEQEHSEKEQEQTGKDGQTEEKDIADKVIELLAPRIEAQMQQLMNGTAMRMLDVLGQKLTRLESRMDEMHNEWKEATASTNSKQQDFRNQQSAGQQYPFGNRHQSAVQQYYGRTQAPPSTTPNQDTNSPAGPEDPLQSFFQEAAQAADNPTIVVPASNRRAPFMSRRPRQPETPRVVPITQQRIHNGTADPADAPQYRLQRGSESVMQLWREFFVGSADKPAINELDHKYGSAWRWKDNKEGVYYSMRRTVIDEIQARVEARCPNSTGATGDVWLAVCDEMDAERTSMQFTLNQYIYELKRRDKPVIAPGTNKWDPNDPRPPPPPVLSRTTPSVQKLWTEWFSGKVNYNGYTTFPSIVQMNHKFGSTWRESTSPEYNIYLKRRCIIDIALRRIVEIGGERTETTKKVLKMMDAERVAHNLSLIQYHAWARDKYGYHASARTHLPKFCADLGEGLEEAIELEAKTKSQQDEEEGVMGDQNTDIDLEILQHERSNGSRSGQGQESSVPPSPASLG